MNALKKIYLNTYFITFGIHLINMPDQNKNIIWNEFTDKNS